MATDLERLVVQLSADVRGYENAMRRAQGVTDRTARNIETRFSRMNRGFTAGLSGFAKGFGGALLAGFTVQEAGRFIEAATRIRNSLKLAGLEGAELTRVYEQLKQSALANGAPFEALVDLYSKVVRVQKELGVSGREVESFTANIAVALRVAGKSASEASGALLQLTQALGGGVVRAEEFNSILEGLPTIAQTVADGMEEAGGSIGKLRQLVVDGKVSSEAFFRAFEAGSVKLREQANLTEQTASQAFTNIGTALTDLAGSFDQSTGASARFVEMLNGVAGAIQGVDEFLGGLIETNKRYRQSLNALDAGALAGSLVGQPGGAVSTPKTGRLPFLPQQAIQDRISGAFSTTVKPIRASDFPVSGDAGGSKSSAKAAERAAKAAAEKIDRAIADHTAIAVDAVSLLLGQDEKTNRGSINAFLQAGGVDLDAATQAWCAAFVNSALAQVGIKGTGSNVATDFLNFGRAVNASDVQRGDILVDPNGRGAGQTGGHVGFATGLARFQQGVLQLQMISGNASNKVQEDWVNATEVVARRATEAASVSADALAHIGQRTQAQTDAIKQQEQAYEQLGNIAETALNGIATALADGKIEGEELLQIVLQIAQQLLSMQGGLGGLFGGGGLGGGGGLLGGFLIPGILHKGGVAGVDGYGHGRMVSPSVFAGAKRYHRGGVAGLQPGEVPAILQRGEIVVPRGGGGAGSGQQEVVLHVIGEEGPMFRPVIQAESQGVAVKVVQGYDKQLNRTIGGKVANAQARQF